MNMKKKGRTMGSKKYPGLQDSSSTGQEIYFIERLGEWGDRPKNKAVLLKKYKEALQYRENWGSISKKDVISFLDGEIKKEENKHTGRYCADCNTPHDGWCCPKCGGCL